MNRSPFKVLWLLLAFICLGVGAAGVVLPILPTTPFLLVASFCFAKGSQRSYQWFLKTGLYQKHLSSFIKNRSMPLKTKICILLPASIMLMIAFFMMHNTPGRVIIILLLLFKYYYFFFRIETLTKSKKKTKKDYIEMEYIE